MDAGVWRPESGPDWTTPVEHRCPLCAEVWPGDQMIGHVLSVHGRDEAMRMTALRGTVDDQTHSEGLFPEAERRVSSRLSPLAERRDVTSDMAALTCAGTDVDGIALRRRIELELATIAAGIEVVPIDHVLRGVIMRVFWLGYEVRRGQEAES